MVGIEIFTTGAAGGREPLVTGVRDGVATAAPGMGMLTAVFAAGDRLFGAGMGKSDGPDGMGTVNSGMGVLGTAGCGLDAAGRGTIPDGILNVGAVSVGGPKANDC